MIFWAVVLLLATGVSCTIGPSGIVGKDGNNIQFTRDFADNIILIGPSGIVTKNGQNLQFTDAQIDLNSPAFRSFLTPAVATPVAPAAPIGQFLTHRGSLVGPSGIVNPDGRNVQFTSSLADNIAVIGPSGIVTKDGNNIQFRNKRSIEYVSDRGNIGTAGILRADGSTDLFSHDFAHNIILIGPSGIVTKDGRNAQLTRDLEISNPAPGTAVPAVPSAPSAPVVRTAPFERQNLIGPSGAVLKSGQPIQFKEAGVSILLEGPSGLILSDGTTVQKWHVV